MRKLKLFSLALMAMFATSLWGTISKQDVPSSTFTCGTTAGYDTYFYTFNSNTANSDTIVFSAYDSYESSITWASYTGDKKGSSSSWKDKLYALVSGTTEVDRNGTPTGLSHKVYNSGNYYIVRSDRTLRYLVTNCTGTMISGYVSSGFTLYLKAYVVTSGTPASSAAQTASITSTSHTTTSISGLDASKTYLIELSGSAADNKHNICEVAFIYPAAAATTHALEWDFAGGSCSATEGEDYTAAGDVAEGATITYPANNTMTKDGFDFAGWSTSATTMPTSDLTIVAQWAAHTESSDATLSALSVAGCTLSPAFAPATTAYTIALPFYASMPAVGDVTATKNDSYAKNPGVSISDNVITVACEAENGTKLNYTITVNFAPVPTASSSINIEQLVLDNGKSYNIGSALDAAHISYADYNALDSLDVGDNDHDRPDYNEPYLGLKFKKATSKVTIIVPSGEALNVKFGATDNLTVSVNGAAAAAPSLTNGVYSLAASEGAKEVVFALTGTKTVVFKQIMVGEDIAVVRPFLATVAPTTNGTASVELPKYAKGEQVTVNCTPASGYQLDGISVSGYTNKGAAMDVTVTDGKFTMPGSPVTITVTFSVATALDNTDAAVKAVKRLENGMLVIEKNGKIYNAQGQFVR